MLSELAAAQASAGLDVEIWTVDKVDTPRVEHHSGYTVRYFAPEYRLGLVGSRELCDALEATVAPDAIVHAHSTFHPLNLQVGAVARRKRLPVFYHPHGALDPSLFPGLSFQSLKKRAYNVLFEVPNLNKASGVFALTALEAEQLRSIGVRSPIFEVPNGVAAMAKASDTAARAFRASWGIGDGEVAILFLGRIVPKKGVHDIIVVMKSLPAKTRLVIAGGREADPAYYSRLVSLSEELGLAERIIWTGHLNEFEKPAAFSGSDVFVHASSSEGMAMAILEAMAHGLPVVATKGCYMGHAAKADALIECEQGPDALSQGLIRLAENQELRVALGARGRAFVADHHRWPAIVRRFSGVYEGMIEPYFKA
jgi:glycosyltransferase involved in cell wall biosynthesis